MIDAFLSVYVDGSRGKRYGYSAEWVNRLHRAATRNLPYEVKHYCLTDSPNGISSDISPIDVSHWMRSEGHGAKGWWAKVCLHDPTMFPTGARLMYSDIDNLIIRDLSPLIENAEGHNFAAAPMTSQNFRKHDSNMERRVSSAFMIWTHGTTSDIYLRWSPGTPGTFYGDQDWMGTHLPNPHVLPRNNFCRGTRLIRRGWGDRPDLRVVFCTKQKNDKLVETIPEAKEHWV